jgi:hypothetical protein
MRTATIPLMSLLSFLVVGACSDDTLRERDIQGLIRCVQLGDEACIARLTCSAAPQALSTADLLQLVDDLRDADSEHLRLISKTRVGRDMQYTYALDRALLRVRFCPPEDGGSIAAVVVEGR